MPYPLTSEVDSSHQPIHSFFTDDQTNPPDTTQLYASNMDTHIFRLEHIHTPLF